MAKSAEVAVVEDEVGTELSEAMTAEEEALVAANQADVNPDEFVVPILKLAQPLTDEVAAGDARPGQYVLGLTGEAFSGPFEFIVAGKGKGRFRPGGQGQRTLVAYDTNIVPDSWSDDPFKGQPFSEHPDAEEQYKLRVDKKEIEWGKGPPVQTTYNFTGYMVVDGEMQEVPVRISLRRTSAPAARKWGTLLDAVLRGRFWDKVFIVDSEQQKNADGQPYYIATAKLGRKATAAEKQQAIGLATALRNQSVTTVGESDDVMTKPPEDNGGMDL